MNVIYEGLGLIETEYSLPYQAPHKRGDRFALLSFDLIDCAHKTL
jgi:hypothetical protein